MSCWYVLVAISLAAVVALLTFMIHLSLKLHHIAANITNGSVFFCHGKKHLIKLKRKIQENKTGGERGRPHLICTVLLKSLNLDAKIKTSVFVLWWTKVLIVDIPSDIRLSPRTDSIKSSACEEHWFNINYLFDRYVSLTSFLFPSHLSSHIVHCQRCGRSISFIKIDVQWRKLIEFIAPDHQLVVGLCLYAEEPKERILRNRKRKWAAAMHNIFDVRAIFHSKVEWREREQLRGRNKLFFQESNARRTKCNWEQSCSNRWWQILTLISRLNSLFSLSSKLYPALLVLCFAFYCIRNSFCIIVHFI